MINKQSYQIQGMRQDNLVGTGFSSKFAHEIMNMRLNTIGDYTTASWTSEKGTLDLSNIEDFGTHVDLSNFKPLGQAVINDVWILFGKLSDNEDCIVKFAYDGNDLKKALLYKGNLNFKLDKPIETLTFFENDDIQKVYWTDKENQPRVINIVTDEAYPSTTTGDETETRFDFVPEVSLNEEVEINKKQLGTGLFPPGSVKYLITYYRKYGSESNIVYESPLYYPTIGDRACSPDEISGDSFEIIVNNVDQSHGFDFIRLYSVIRTSDDATPIVRIVEDKSLSQSGNDNSVTFIDNNTTGTIVDPDIIQYLGGRQVGVGTMNQKDNTLFLGDITLKQESLASLNINIDNNPLSFDNAEDKKLIPLIKRSLDRISYYRYHNEMNPTTIQTSIDSSVTYHGNSNEFKVFKKGETYRFGIQAQDRHGIWSDVIPINVDKVCDVAPSLVSLDLSPVAYKASYAKLILDSNNVNTLINNKYKKVRLVCCYPTVGEKKVLAQGIITPTVKNNKMNKDHIPDYMASWFFRTNAENKFQREVYSYQDTEYVKKPKGQYSKRLFDDPDNYSLYELNNSILTLNSPDIELDESIRTFDLTNMIVNKIGEASIKSFCNAIYLDSTSAYEHATGIKGTGLINKTLIGYQVGSTNIHYMQPFALWSDHNVYNEYANNKMYLYPIYPFHRNSSLNNYIKDVNPWSEDKSTESGDLDTNWSVKQSAKINSKVLSYLTYSKSTVFNNESKISNGKLDWFDSNEVMPVLLGQTVYYGNMNTISPTFKLPTTRETLQEYSIKLLKDADGLDGSNDTQTFTSTGSYLIKYLEKNGDNNYNIKHTFNFGRLLIRTTGEDASSDLLCADPVPITYKSTPHLVFTATGFNYDSSDGQNLILGELVRSEAKRNNPSYNDVYLPCGPAETLVKDENCVVYGLEGDHYLMRYDCLKTYPYTTEDVNQIVEIASIMCETSINLDGRYDKNRGLADNTMILPTNFNLINKSYTQKNNLFSYLRLDELDAKLNIFSNQFTWTKEKVSGESIDAWTNITLASTADADGTLGSITKISNLNNNLLLFQDHGLAQIGYNENTAISTENGVPLELAKTGKYTGLNYISREIGCQNKWSISQSKNGIFWIDDSRQEMLRYGEGIQSLSSLSGFDAFMIKELPSPFKVWNPDTFDNFVTYYDKLSNDIYYINKNYCLAWNELSQTFTSFYNYEEVPYMINIGQHSLMWKDRVYAARESTNYNTFFGNLKDYWMTLVCDGQTDKGSAFPADKVFNNIEYRADIYNLDGTNANYSKTVFNKQHVWNGYQDSQECNLDGIRKFNTWRVQLPRHYGTRDRIRNPFCYIKLKQDQSVNTQTDRMILHDLAVYFDMR